MQSNAIAAKSNLCQNNLNLLRGSVCDHISLKIIPYSQSQDLTSMYSRGSHNRLPYFPILSEISSNTVRNIHEIQHVSLLTTFIIELN